MIRNIRISIRGVNDIELSLIKPDRERLALENYFTVIIGENGSYKSEILRGIALQIRGGVKGPFLFVDSELENEKVSCIAVSTSPFDKFPLIKSEMNRTRKILQNNSDSEPERYFYFGLKSGGGFRRGSQRVFDVILSALSSSRGAPAFRGMCECFKLLGLKPELAFHFGRRKDKGISESAIRKLAHEKLNDFEVEKLMNGYREILKHDSSLHREIDSPWVFHVNFRDSQKLEGRKLLDFMYTYGLMLKIGVLRLNEIRAFNIDQSLDGFNLNAGSSGQLSLMLGLIGIASVVSDNTIVLIDEPEISLHPSWQIKFIETLKMIAADVHSCQFIIATHSPYILSSLPQNDSSVIALKYSRSKGLTSRLVEGGVTGWSIEDILTDVFGVRTARNAAVESDIVSLGEMIAGVKPYAKSEFEARMARLRNLNLNNSDPINEFLDEAQKFIDRSI